MKKLICKSNEENEIVCTHYKGDIAVPAIFSNSHYEKLLSLKGDKGAKIIIKRNNYKSIFLDDSLAFDIDTTEDKIYLNKKVIERY
ncbi:hypothetical protein [Arcobacter sp. F155]|uniref:hypothetical protein n=1 Tax=Arcobacter sp. F155 TaxID=2044512 RepID=UPI002159D261|nr:hypothetical protein [Arcobacter sp. F155]